MKEIRISVAQERTTGDVFMEYSFDFNKLVEKATGDYQKLSDHDKKKRRAIFVTEYKIEIPDDYSATTPEQLVRDLFNGDVESEQFDSSFGFSDQTAVNSRKIV